MGISAVGKVSSTLIHSFIFATFPYHSLGRLPAKCYMEIRRIVPLEWLVIFCIVENLVEQYIEHFFQTSVTI
jgi:hypothetical protein